MNANLLALVVLALLLGSDAQTRAGELSTGLGTCDLTRSLFGCTWKPSGCYKPTAPIAFVSDVRSYNEAVEEYNRYLSEVDSYKNCLVDEAKNDITNAFPALVEKGVKEAADDVDNDAQSARRNLEMERPR